MKTKCNALLKQDSKIKATAKYDLQPRTHFAFLTQAQRRYCSSTRLLFSENEDIFGHDAYFFHSSRPRHETNASYKAIFKHKIKPAVKKKVPSDGTS